MKNKSFTLIELLVVIVIIGILAGVIIVSVSSSINKANFAKAQAFSNTVQNELLGDLVSEWTFDNPSLPGEDTWGNNDGTVTGATYKPKADGECVYGGCYEFDGVDDQIEVEGSNVSNSNLAITGAITLSSWLKSAKKDEADFIMGRGLPFSPLNNLGYSISKGSTNRFIFDIHSASERSYVISTTIVIDSNWHFVVGAWDGTLLGNGMKIYIDGKLDNQNTSIVSLVSQPTYNFKIGSDVAGAHYFDGLIDDSRIYTLAPSNSQIKQKYIAGLDSLLSKNIISQEDYDQRLNNLAQN